MGRKSAASGAVLSVDKIVTAAWELVDELGLDALSTRTLALRLDVKSPALYWHVKNKSELISLMFERVLLESVPPENNGMGWEEWTRQLCHRQHAALRARRNSGRIATIAVPSERIQREILPRMYRPLVDAGLSTQDAVAAAGAVIAFILGWVIYEQRPDTLRFIRSLVEIDSAFSFGVETFLAGLETKIAAARNPA